MADEIKIALAKTVFNTLCVAIEKRNWSFKKNEEELSVAFDVNGDDIPMRFIMIIDIERQLIRLFSPMTFSMSEEKRIDGAIATCHATYEVTDGGFDYDLSSGSIMFRMTASFYDSTIGEELLQYMISNACYYVDEYNDKFLAIDKGFISISDFISAE